MTVAIHLIIEGRVQGVGYRAWTASRARELGLSGWVRNRRDGTVEAVISGDEAVVQQMVEDCHRGSPIAKVTRVNAAAWDGELLQGFAPRETV